MAEGDKAAIIKKVIEEGHGGHHGGAWKVAYADFATAMMAFFLMMWLISTSSEEQLAGIAEHFSDATTDTGLVGGSGGLLSEQLATQTALIEVMPNSPFSRDSAQQMDESEDEADTPFTMDVEEAIGQWEALEEAQRQEEDAGKTEEELEAEQLEQFEKAQEAIEEAIAGTPELEDLADSLMMDVTEDGLRIQIVDQNEYSMFPSGSAEMYPRTEELLQVVARAIAELPNRVSIRGHTDSTRFSAASGYDNWRLSTDRANATRQALTRFELSPRRVEEVIGKADTEHLFEETPNDPRNRRISIVLLNRREGGGGRRRGRNPLSALRVRRLATTARLRRRTARRCGWAGRPKG